MKLTALTIQQIEDLGKGPLYVLNNTGNAPGTKSGNVLLAIPRLTGNGNPIMLRIPATWLPIEVTSQIAYSQLVPTHEFRNAINNNWIIPISREYAEHLLSKPGAQEEKERLEEEYKAAINAGPARGMSEEETMQIDDGASSTNTFVNQIDGFEPSFIAKVNRWIAMEDIAVLNELRSMGRIKRSQLNYILSRLKNHPKTCASIERILKK